MADPQVGGPPKVPGQVSCLLWDSHLTPRTSHITHQRLTPRTSHLAPHTSHLAPVGGQWGGGCVCVCACGRVCVRVCVCVCVYAVCAPVGGMCVCAWWWGPINLKPQALGPSPVLALALTSLDLGLPSTHPYCCPPPPPSLMDPLPPCPPPPALTVAGLRSDSHAVTHACW